MATTIGNLAVVVTANNQVKQGLDAAIGNIEAGARRLKAKGQKAEAGAFLKGEGGIKGGLEKFFGGGGLVGGFAGALSGSFLVGGIKQALALVADFPTLYHQATESAQEFFTLIGKDQDKDVAKRQQQARDLAYYDKLREKAELYAEANDRAAKAAADFSRNVNLSQASIGKSGAELEKLKLLYQGVALTAEAYQKARKVEKELAIAAAISQQRDAYAALNQEIQNSIAKVGLSPGEARLFDATRGGVFGDDLKGDVAKLEALQAAQALLDVDPGKQFVQQRQGLKLMLEEGRIGAQRYAAELEKATEQLQQQQNIELNQPRRLVQGSAAANNAILDARRQEADKARILEELNKDQLGELKDIKTGVTAAVEAIKSGLNFEVVDF